MSKQIAHFPGPNGGYYVESWMTKKGDLRVRVIDNEDALTTNLKINSGGIEVAWYGDEAPYEFEVDNRAAMKSA